VVETAHSGQLIKGHCRGGIQMNEVFALLERHRSIRKFQDQPVEESVIARLIETGQHAATSSFLQAYSVIRVKDPEKRRQLSVWCGGQQHVQHAPLFFVFCGDLNRLKLACELQGVTMKQGWTELFITATVDTAILGQSVLIAAESLGLGGVYVGAIRNHPREVSDLLELPDQVYPIFGMSLGYPDQDPRMKPRLPLSLVLMEDTYHQDISKLKEYDETIRSYLLNRSHNPRDESWSFGISEKLKKESRPHMRAFLTQQGFEMK
jgi:nitroreductase